MPGRIFKERGDRWGIELGKPWNVRIYCDKQHRTLYYPKQAKWVLSQIQGEIENGTFDPDFYSKHKRSVRSFNSYVSQWLANCDILADREELSPSYVRRLKGQVEKHLKPAFGETDMQSINEGMIEDFYLRLKVSPKTRKNLMATLHKIFVTAKRRKLIGAIPDFPEMQRFQKKEVPWMESELQSEVRKHLNPIADFIVWFCIVHACRIGEARALKHKDINLRDNTVTIQRTFSGKHLRPVTKGKRARTIPLLDPEWTHLYVSRYRGLPEAFVFTHNGRPLGQNYAYRAWIAACETVETEHCTLHQGTRHSKITQLLKDGVPAAIVQKLVGHEQLSTTEGYDHTNNVEIIRQAIQQATQGKVVEMRRRAGE